jgi:predicted dehydrogenase
MKKTRIGIVGTGFIADYHARAILDNPEAELATVISRGIDQGKAFADRYGSKQIYISLEDCIAAGCADALVFCTPNLRHHPDSIQALEGGLHVLVEKPMACSATQAEEMKEVAEKAGKILMTGHMWRFDPEIRWARRLVKEGVLGKIYRTKGYGVHVNWGPSGWFTQNSLAGGGALADMGVHALDTARFLLGDPAPVSVFARIETLFGDYDVDDTGIVMITWDNGCTSVIESGWWQPHTGGPEAAARLSGTEGYISIFPTKAILNIGGQRSYCRPEFPSRKEHCGQQLYTDQLAAFIKAIRKGNQNEIPADIGLVIVKIVDAAMKSSKTGEVIYF